MTERGRRTSTLGAYSQLSVGASWTMDTLRAADVSSGEGQLQVGYGSRGGWGGCAFSHRASQCHCAWGHKRDTGRCVPATIESPAPEQFLPLLCPSSSLLLYPPRQRWTHNRVKRRRGSRDPAQSHRTPAAIRLVAFPSSIPPSCLFRQKSTTPTTPDSPPLSSTQN